MIILISICLITEYVEDSTIKHETFAEIKLDDTERNALYSYKAWLKINESTIKGVHVDNFITLFHREPIIITDNNIIPKIDIPKETNLDGSIDFLQEQNKLVTRNFEEHANKIGLISSNEDALNLYVNTSHVDHQIVVLDPRESKNKKKKLPKPIKKL